LSDPGKSVAKAYGVVTPEREFPHRWTYYIGPDGKILYVDKEVKTETAGADIASRLEALGVKKK
jgi:peroxiredoxin Q/BCP